MHAGGFGLNPPHPQFAGYPPPMQPQMQGMQMQGMQMQGAPQHDPSAGNPGMADPAQLQQLVQLLGAKMLPKQTAVVECPKSMVGRVIGKGGETIKSLQQYTGAMIQVRGGWSAAGVQGGDRAAGGWLAGSRCLPARVP